MGQVIDLMRDWRVEDGEFVIDPNGDLVVRLPKQTHPVMAELQQHRVRLIASAPALLEALKATVELLESINSTLTRVPKSVSVTYLADDGGTAEMPVSVLAETLAGEIAELLDAIAQAEGGE